MASVLDQVPFTEHIANGVTLVFAYEFELLSAGDLVVTANGAVVSPSEFTLSGVGDEDGGDVTFLVAPANGVVILLSREIALERDTDYQEGGDLLATTLDRDFDRIWQAMQGQRSLLGGAVRAPFPEQLAALPAALARANKLLYFGASGEPLAVDYTPGSPVTSAAGVLWSQVGTGAVARTVDAKLREVVSVLDFGAVGDGTTDDTLAISRAATAAAANKATLYIPPGKVYKFNKLVFPANSNVQADGAELRSDGLLTVSGDLTVDIGANSTFDRLKITTPGTETNLDILRLGVGFWAEKVDLVSDTQRAGGGITTTGQDVQIGILRTRKIDRPIHFYNQSVVAQTTGAYLGAADFEDYVRGFRADYCSFTTGPMKMRGRSPNASMTAGHNSILIVGCAGWQMGNLYLADSGEHAFRIGGSPGAYARTRDFTVGNMLVERSGGCALKINPTLLVSAGVTEKTECFSFGNIVGIDIGDGTVAGNEELLRLTHARRGRIASAIAYTKNETRSAQYALQINDCDDIEIGALGGEALNAGFINILGTSDTDGVSFFGGDVTDIRIGRLLGATAGNNAIGVNTAFNVGRFFIGDMDVTGFTTNLLLWSAGTLTDVFEIMGRVTGAVAPAVSGLPTSTFLVADIRYANTRTMGRLNALRLAMASFQASQDAFSNGNVVPAGFFAIASLASAGVGTYGGSYEMSRPGSGRRGAAVAAKQTGSNVQDMGLSFLAGASSSATDALFELGVFKHNGSLFYTNLPTFANNAAALGGGLVVGDSYKTATGELRITV